jgi:hypothetical protein
MYDKKQDDGTYYNASMYEGIRSSVMYLFKVCDVSPPDEFLKVCLLRALKRAIITQKVAHGKSLEEGKKVMSSNIYFDQYGKVVYCINLFLLY